MAFIPLTPLCPACKKECHGPWDDENNPDCYIRWREIEGIGVIWVCRECAKKELTINELIRIGFMEGFGQCEQLHQKAINSVENPLGPSTAYPTMTRQKKEAARN